jgi:nitrite reductase (NAD(P)H)
MLQSSYFDDKKDSPAGSSASLKRGDTMLALFYLKGKYYCTQQMCPHKRAFVLSDGLIGDTPDKSLYVSCPNHKRNFTLSPSPSHPAGSCQNDENVSVATFEVQERDDGWIYVKLPPVEELDEVLGTKKWMVKAGETEDPFVKMDEKLKGMRSRKVVNGAGEMGRRLGQEVRVGGEGGGGLDW